MCLSDDTVLESSASLTGTYSSLSVRQGEQHPAHQMVICPTSHLRCIPEPLQPRAASSTHAARQFLPTTLPNGSSQSHGLPRQTGSSICSSFWQRDISLSGSTSWLHQNLLARRMIWPLSPARPGILEPFRAYACVPLSHPSGTVSEHTRGPDDHGYRQRSMQTFTAGKATDLPLPSPTLSLIISRLVNGSSETKSD